MQKTEMKKTLILGPQGSGKTYLVRKMIAGKKAAYYDTFRGGYKWRNIQQDTEVVYIDEYIDEYFAKDLRSLLQTGSITVKHPGKDPFEFKIPELIIATQSGEQDLFNDIDNLEIIRLTEKRQ